MPAAAIPTRSGAELRLEHRQRCPRASQPKTVTFIVTDTNGTSNLFTPTGQPAIDGSTSATPGTLRYTLAQDVFGTAQLSVVAQNSGSGNNTSAAQTATITVIGIDDPPTLDAITNPTPILKARRPRRSRLTGITAGLERDAKITITAAATPQAGENPSLVTNLSVNYTQPQPHRHTDLFDCGRPDRTRRRLP